MHHEHLVYPCNHHFFFWHFQVDCDCHQSRILSQMPTHLNAEEQTAHTQIRPVPICKFVRRLHTVKPWDDPSWIMESDMTGTGGLPSSGTQSFYLCFTLKGFSGQKFTCCSLSKKKKRWVEEEAKILTKEICLLMWNTSGFGEKPCQCVFMLLRLCKGMRSYPPPQFV